jgi:hypothetical protein
LCSVSPDEALTSNTPSNSSTRDTSNVPPPRSKIRNVFSSRLSWKPWAIAAAVGSLTMRSTFKPAILPALMVALRCWPLK